MTAVMAGAPLVDPARIGDGDIVHGDPDGLIQVVLHGDLDDTGTAEAHEAVRDAAARYRCIRWAVRPGPGAEPTTFINGVRWQPGPGHVLYGDLCRLAEVTRPLWGLR